MLDDFNTRLEERFENASRLIEEKCERAVRTIQSISESLIMLIKGIARVIWTLTKSSIKIGVNILGLVMILLSLLFVMALGVEMPGIIGWLIIIFATIGFAVLVSTVFTRGKKTEQVEKKPKRNIGVFSLGCTMIVITWTLYILYASNFEPTPGTNFVVVVGCHLAIVVFDALKPASEWLFAHLK